MLRNSSYLGCRSKFVILETTTLWPEPGRPPTLPVVATFYAKSLSFPLLHITFKHVSELTPFQICIKTK